MSKILRRPMFKMGGNADSGIVSGFERKKYDQGTQEEDYTSTYLESVEKERDALNQLMGTAFPEEAPSYAQPGFGMSEWLALAKLGANIASSPNRGEGFKAFAASTAPAFGQFAEDIDVLNREKMNRAAEYDATRKDALLKIAGTQAQLGADAAGGVLEARTQQDITEMQIAGSLTQEKIKAITDLAVAQENLTSPQLILKGTTLLNQIIRGSDPNDPTQNSRRQDAIQSLKTLNDTGSEEKAKLRKSLMEGNIMEITSNVSRIDAIPNEERTGDLARFKDLNSIEIKALLVNEMVNLTYPEQDLYIPEYEPGYVIPEDTLAWYKRGGTSASLADFSTSIEGFKTGGRVGYANGTDPYEERYKEKELDPGPMEPGPMPDPNAPPVMQASSPISYEELRARLPREVSDEVIRLLASSEQALLDFAQIQTQDDIARFNQKYNADLVLPSQNQAV
jgi:hypothetical protein